MYHFGPRSLNTFGKMSSKLSRNRTSLMSILIFDIMTSVEKVKMETSFFADYKVLVGCAFSLNCWLFFSNVADLIITRTALTLYYAFY